MGRWTAKIAARANSVETGENGPHGASCGHEKIGERLSVDERFSFSALLMFRLSRLVQRSTVVLSGGVHRSILVLGLVDDRWESKDSGYDPCDPRFDMKKVILRFHSPRPAETLLTKENPDWKELIESERAPIGSLKISEGIEPFVIEGTEYPPVDFDFWLEAGEFSACESIILENVEQVEGSVELALTRENLLEQSRSSTLRSRYLRDIDIAVARKFPVVSLSLQSVPI
jgi:hypothetical protein